jgi:hypothetical protein
MRRFNFEKTLKKIKDWIDRTLMYVEAMFNALKRSIRYNRALRELGNDAYLVREDAEETLRQGRWEALPWIERGKASMDPEVQYRAKRLYEELYQPEGRKQMDEAIHNYGILFVHPGDYTRDQQEAAADFFRRVWGFSIRQGTRHELLTLLKRKFDEWVEAIPVPMPRKYLRVVDTIRGRIADILIHREEPVPESAPSPGIPPEEEPMMEETVVPPAPPVTTGEGG